MPSPTGLQFELSRSTPHGDARAVITEVAASLRILRLGDIDLTEPYAADVVAPFGDGTVLVPWPNRIEDGLWMHEGRKQRLDITEPKLNNALHGLLRDRPYALVEQEADAVTLGATVFPTRGYPFQLDTTVTYRLTDDGITVSHSLANVGHERAPFALGTHPFLRVGDVPVSDLTLTLAAGTRFKVDARLNPIVELPVDGTGFDLREGRLVADLDLDHAFGGVTPVDGVSHHRLTAPDGRWVELWQEASFPFVQVYTTRIFPKDGGLYTAIAVEPMTAPPNAFNSGQGLLWLEPGQAWAGSWGIRYSGRHEGE